MKDFFKELYYIEEETNCPQLSEGQQKIYENEHKAYESFFNLLTDEQKSLFLVYQNLRDSNACEEKEALYRRAFLSGFSFAQEIFRTKNV